MSNQEKFNSMIQEITEIFVFLRDKEPTPDDEIEAREKLIEKFKILKEINENGEIQGPINDALSKLQNWDTLELWFNEVEGLTDSIEKVISLSKGAEKQKKEREKAVDKKIQEAYEAQAAKSEQKADESAGAANINIDQIVAQVSEQFKGTIDGLKSKIDNLKKELEEKEKKLAQEEKTEKKSKEQIKVKKTKQEKKSEPEPKQKTKKAKKKTKLPPPEIKIPHIGGPKKKPQKKSEPEKLKAAEVKTEPKKPSAPKIKSKPEKLKAPQVQPKEKKQPKSQKSEPAPAKVQKVTPVETKETQKPKIKPVSPQKPQVSPNNQNKPQVSSANQQKPKIDAVTTQKPKISPVSSEKPKITPGSQQKPKIAPVAAEKPQVKPSTKKKPKISPVRVVEVGDSEEEEEPKKADLFNVFSSVGRPKKKRKPQEEPKKIVKPISGQSAKPKRKRGSRKRKRGESPGGGIKTKSVFGFEGSESGDSSSDTSFSEADLPQEIGRASCRERVCHRV